MAHKIIREGKEPPSTKDEYLDILFKMIPAEATAIFITINAFAGSFPDNAWLIQLIALIFGVAATALILIKGGKEDSRLTWNKDKKQIILTEISFLIWVLAIGGIFTQIPWIAINTWFGGVLVIGWTFFVPYLMK